MLEINTNEITEIGVESAISGGVITGGYEGVYLPIVDLLLKDKFQLYQKTRSELISNILTDLPLDIFSQFENPLEDDKKYLLVGYSYDFNEENLEGRFLEYDNSDNINLI